MLFLHVLELQQSRYVKTFTFNLLGSKFCRLRTSFLSSSLVPAGSTCSRCDPLNPWSPSFINGRNSFPDWKRFEKMMKMTFKTQQCPPSGPQLILLVHKNSYMLIYTYQNKPQQQCTKKSSNYANKQTNSKLQTRSNLKRFKPFKRRLYRSCLQQCLWKLGPKKNAANALCLTLTGRLTQVLPTASLAPDKHPPPGFI